MAYYSGYYSKKKYIEKRVLNNLKTFSHNKLIEFEKNIPKEQKKIHETEPKIQLKLDKLREKKSSIDDKINEIIEKKIGSRPVSALSDKYWNIIWGISVLGSGFWMYLKGGLPIYFAFFLAIIIVGGLISVIPATIIETLITFNSDKRQKDYDKKYYPLREEIEKTYFKKIKLPINYFEKEDKKLEDQLSKLRLKSLHYYGVIEIIYSLKTRAKRREEKAKISAFDKNAREGAQVVRSDLLKSIRNKKNWKCPYCNKQSDIKTSHADHIHPVFKGGLSTPQNMVLICRSCNSKKRTLTLRSFCKSREFNYDKVCDRLELLGKDV